MDWQITDTRSMSFFTKEELEGLETGIISRITYLENWAENHGQEISKEDQQIIEWNRKLLNKISKLKHQVGGN
jgi:hypothetical protein